MNAQTQCGKRLHLGIRRDSFFILVALELTSNQMLWVQRRNGAEYFDLFIMDSVAIRCSRTGPCRTAHVRSVPKLQLSSPHFGLCGRSTGVAGPLDLSHTVPQGPADAHVEVRGHYLSES